MKIYCFADYHNEKAFLPEMKKLAMQADIIISAGDHTIFEYEQESILKAFNAWNKPFYLIHGNHEEESTLRAACKHYKNLHFIHAEEAVIRGIRLLAWGGGGFNAHDRGLDRKISEWRKSPHAKLPTILVTHAPPHGTTLDEKDPSWHVGNKTVKKAIKHLRPLYAVSGHIHDAQGAEDTIGETVCYNLGPVGRIIDV